MERKQNRVQLLLVVLAISCGASCMKKAGITAGPDFQKQVQEALINAKPGAVIELPEGKHDLDRTLSLSVENVTVRGKGMDKTILSFKNQKAGAAGVLVTSSGFTIEDVAIEDPKGDALKINGANGVTIRRVRTEWTGGPKETNGSYGMYPVQCTNVLIEDSVAIGASDAGIYVGQSKNIIMRRNRAELNVAGMEVENSQNADVYQNTATRNTGGILLFNLPDLPVKDGKNARVFENNIFGNNTANFAPKGNIVAKVPTGSGLIVLATSHIDVYKNTIKDNNSANVSIYSYLTTGNPINDPTYDPYTDSIYVHDNAISGGGSNPAGRTHDLVPVLGVPVPAIVYDGILRPNTKDAHICIQNNGDATFANYDAAHKFKHVSRDLKMHDCSLPPLQAVSGVGPTKET
jgi:parallel beta-helix repeat protein